MTPLVAREDVERFRDLIARRMGLQFEDTKLDSLADVLRERMEALSCWTFASYEQRLAGSGTDEMRGLAGRLTVAETYFFRYWNHFRAFTEVVLPARAAAPGSHKRLNVLSAGCASGEEPYSLAIMVREHLPSAASLELNIHAVDINPAVLERATRGRYSNWSLRETPKELSARHFRAEGRDFQLSDVVRSMVVFEERNLVEDADAFWREGRFDVVFFRNVMMYFNPEVVAATVSRISRALSPGGYLFLGHAETLRGVSSDFHLRHTHETFYYQRREGAPVRLPEIARATAPRAAPSDKLAAALDLADTSWISAIQQASDRIEHLTREPPSKPPRGRSSSTASNNGRPRADLGPAFELLRQERFAEAMDALPAGVEDSTVDLDAQLLRAVLLMNRGLLAEAESMCDHILGSDELNAGAHYLMALCREHAGDRDAAVEHDRAAAYLDTGFAMPHLHLGLLVRRAGDVERARSELGRAILLLTHEEPSRILLFGGGFSREALVALCRSELQAAGGVSS
jgi:chemotaxis protein methyltransferase CheR